MPHRPWLLAASLRNVFILDKVFSRIAPRPLLMRARKPCLTNLNTGQGAVCGKNSHEADLNN
jgi:hypothetical protein